MLSKPGFADFSENAMFSFTRFDDGRIPHNMIRVGSVEKEGNLQAALVNLRSARDIFGGHKQNAEAAVHQALGELQGGKA